MMVRRGRGKRPPGGGQQEAGKEAGREARSTTFHALPYVSKKLHAALLTVPVADPPDPASGFPPLVLWSLLAGQEEPLPVWLLTPALLAVIRDRADQIDARILAGRISADRAAEIVARYDRVMTYARDAAAAGWWYCGPAAAKDTPPPEEPPRPWDFDEVVSGLAAAELAEAHNADAVERWLKKAHKRPRKVAEGRDDSGAKPRPPKRPGGRREASAGTPRPRDAPEPPQAPDLFIPGQGESDGA
jgi:hypothetical protein